MQTNFTDLSFLEEKDKRQVLILDTNVVLHDPASIFRFEEHVVLIPFSVCVTGRISVVFATF